MQKTSNDRRKLKLELIQNTAMSVDCFYLNQALAMFNPKHQRYMNAIIAAQKYINQNEQIYLQRIMDKLIDKAVDILTGDGK